MKIDNLDFIHLLLLEAIASKLVKGNSLILPRIIGFHILSSVFFRSRVYLPSLNKWREEREDRGEEIGERIEREETREIRENREERY